MSLLWMDGFDHYGAGATGRLNMLLGVWAELDAGFGPSVTFARTGSYSLYSPFMTNGNFGRRILGAAKKAAGVGYAMRISALPTYATGHSLATFADTANAGQCAVHVGTTGSVSAYRCTGIYHELVFPALASSADGVIVTGSWQHIEVFAQIGNADGAVEVRVDGVTVLSIAGVDTQNTANEETSQVLIGNPMRTPTGGAHTTYYDDMFAWDTLGTANNTFVGDRKVYTLFPDSDQAAQEMDLIGAGTGYECINQAEQDGDTTYLNAPANAGSPPYVTSEFGVTDLPGTAVAVTAVQTYVMARKTDAGDANYQISMLSGGEEAAGAEYPLTTSYNYRTDAHDVDPNTGSAWTPAGVNAATLRIRRTL